MSNSVNNHINEHSRLISKSDNSLSSTANSNSPVHKTLENGLNGREISNTKSEENIANIKIYPTKNKVFFLISSISIIISLMVGIIITIVFVTCWVTAINMISKKVYEEMTLRNNSFLFQQWLSPDAIMYKDVYFFNWTNPSCLSKGEKPNFVQIGPYKYRDYRKKTLSNFSSDFCQVEYTQHRTFEFDRSATDSNLSEDDIITVLNIPVASAAFVTKDSFLMRLALDALIQQTNSSIFIQPTVYQFLWGYSDSFIEALKNIYMFPKDQNFSILINDDVRDQYPSIVHTGLCNHNKAGEYIQWNGQQVVDIWNDKYANMINGTEGYFFHPFLKSNEEATVWIDDAMRSIDLAYLGASKYYQGIFTNRYGFSAKFLQNATLNPENARWFQFCPNGLFYVGNSSISKNVPLYSSKPHFLDCDPKLLETITGLSPNREIHELYVDIEPTSGVVISTNVRVQLNFRLEQFDVYNFENISNTIYFPILYTDENIVVEDDIYANLNFKLNLINLIYIICFSLICVGCFLIVFSSIAGIYIIPKTVILYKHNLLRKFRKMTDGEFT